MLDFKKLKNDTKAREQELRELKKLFRESGQPNLKPDEIIHAKYEGGKLTVPAKLIPGSRATCRHLKHELSVLYSIRAHHRGRLHILKRATANPAGGPPIYVPTDLKWQEEMISKAGPTSKETWISQYTLPDLTAEDIARLKEKMAKGMLVGACPNVTPPR